MEAFFKFLGWVEHLESAAAGIVVMRSLDFSQPIVSSHYLIISRAGTVKWASHHCLTRSLLNSDVNDSLSVMLCGYTGTTEDEVQDTEDKAVDSTPQPPAPGSSDAVTEPSATRQADLIPQCRTD
jgi:hypothetical protein